MLFPSIPFYTSYTEGKLYRPSLLEDVVNAKRDSTGTLDVREFLVQNRSSAIRSLMSLTTPPCLDDAPRKSQLVVYQFEKVLLDLIVKRLMTGRWLELVYLVTVLKLDLTSWLRLVRAEASVWTDLKNLLARPHVRFQRASQMWSAFPSPRTADKTANRQWLAQGLTNPLEGVPCCCDIDSLNIRVLRQLLIAFLACSMFAFAAITAECLHDGDLSAALWRLHDAENPM
ncbi:MAG: uncharacterized protein KVP18_004825 [Porospora cf. gigantea A]|nr:MAG: hypothetical protein KVP18_004825 [Porospora cf. gigantea A]